MNLGEPKDTLQRIVLAVKRVGPQHYGKMRILVLESITTHPSFKHDHVRFVRYSSSRSS